ncbi:hypothetical protein ANCDUO_00988 [Ancylostoma duodenale]|uniref:Uncharacterized protein n=1 Tax=Ancylostoma duodenale TaxID=51022 RepID=A0A0C2HAL2_9BILA|nr:hypothetical protein ANCDUO_00988 [Ancylostoma duodenale]
MMATSMTTSLASSTVQSRREPQKRQCLDLNSPPAPRDLEHHADALLKDESLPSNVRMAISWLLDDRRQLSAMLGEYRKLNEQVDLLTSECANLESAIDRTKRTLSSHPADPQSVPVTKPSADFRECSAPPALPVRSFDDVERARSHGSVSFAASHTLSTLPFPFLFGKGWPEKDSRCFQMLRRAPRLKHFKAPGVFLRPSLTKEERERQRAQRVARRNTHTPVSTTQVIHDCVATQDSSNDIPVSDISPSNL